MSGRGYEQGKTPDRQWPQTGHFQMLPNAGPLAARVPAPPSAPIWQPQPRAPVGGRPAPPGPVAEGLGAVTHHLAAQ